MGFLEREISRRQFLQRVAKTTVGVAVPASLLPLVELFFPSSVPRVEAQSSPPDFYIFVPGSFEGRFYTQTREEADYPKGFAVIDDSEAKLWGTFNRYGGIERWGYPISNRWKDEEGRICQGFQKGIFQLTVGSSGNPLSIEWMNIYDELEKRKISLEHLLIPPSYSWDSDQEKHWAQNKKERYAGSIEENHIRRVFGEITQFPQLREAYFKNPLWFEQYGLPMGTKDYGGVVVVRCQRAILQLWKDKMPWTTNPYEVAIANSGEVAKDYGLIPNEAATPVDPPLSQQLTIEQFNAGLIVWRGDTQKPYVYLTVDDLWDPKSAEVFLNIADAKGIKITFFPVGNVMGLAPETYRRAVASGHSIENHTCTHRWLSNLSDAEIRWEIREQREIVQAIIGDSSYSQHFLRPPGGAGIFNFDPRIPQIAHQEGLKIAMWTADSNGWRVHPRADKEAQAYTMRNIRNGFGKGAIVLQHGVVPDIAVFARLIDEIKRDGFIPATLTQGIS